jgi:hypothetical protein
MSSVRAEDAQRAGLIRSDRLARPTIALKCPGSVGLNSTRLALYERRRKLCDRCYRAMSLRLFAAPRGPRGVTCQLAILQKGCVEFAWLNPPSGKPLDLRASPRGELVHNSIHSHALRRFLEHVRRFQPHLIISAPCLWNTIPPHQCQGPTPQPDPISHALVRIRPAFF